MPQKTLKELIAEKVDEIVKDLNKVTKVIKDLEKQGVAVGKTAKFKTALNKLAACHASEDAAVAETASGAASGRLSGDVTEALGNVLLGLIEAAGGKGIATAELKRQYVDSDLVADNPEYKTKYQSRISALVNSKKIVSTAVETGNPKKGSIIKLKR